MPVIQEKYQVTYKPQDDDNGTTWITDQEARAKKNTPGREGRPGGDSASRFLNNAVHFNSLPPGMDIEDQEMTDQRRFNHSVNGNFATGPNAGDRTQELTAQNVGYRVGYSKKALLQTDDEYSRQHNDAFYDDIGGFVERNNYLDRL